MKTGNAAMLRLTLICILCCTAAVGLSACSAFVKTPAADTAVAAKRTAYLNCGGCHGGQNVQVYFMAPKIIGQKRGYLAAKMHDFRDLKRLHPKMNGVLSAMTDQDIANLADYYSSYGRTEKPSP